MIRTWVADVTSLLKKEKYLQYYKIVPDFRKEKADKIVYQEGKALSVGVWYCMRRCAEHMDCRKMRFLNLSHSGQYVLCSVVDSERQNMASRMRYRRCQAGETGCCQTFFLYVRISKNLGAEYGRGKSRGVLSLLGAEGKFYESN